PAPAQGQHHEDAAVGRVGAAEGGGLVGGDEAVQHEDRGSQQAQRPRPAVAPPEPDEVAAADLGETGDQEEGDGREQGRLPAYSRKRFTMGSRQSLPKARGVILMPMGPCRRLYSLRSTIAITRFTVAASKPRATMSATPWSPSTYASRIASRIGYGGSVSWSVWSGRSSADGGRSKTERGITSRPARRFTCSEIW